MTSNSLFTSKRERRLWAWTLAVVIAIYSTLGLAATLAGVLRERGKLDLIFVLCFFLVMITIITQGLKKRPGGTEIGVAIGIIAVYLLVFVRMGIPVVERTHLIEYGVVAIFIYEALMERRNRGRHIPAPALLAVLATTLVGTIDECIQFFLPSRVFDPIDFLFNFLAALMSVAASLALGWARRKTSKKNNINI